MKIATRTSWSAPSLIASLIAVLLRPEPTYMLPVIVMSSESPVSVRNVAQSMTVFPATVTSRGSTTHSKK
jgi:hypothetical protein